jgi:hypothetical protein
MNHDEGVRKQSVVLDDMSTGNRRSDNALASHSDESRATWALAVILIFGLTLLLASTADHRVFEGLGYACISASVLLGEPRLLMWAIAPVFDYRARRDLASKHARRVSKWALWFIGIIVLQVLITGGLLAATAWLANGNAIEARFIIGISFAAVTLLSEFVLVVYGVKKVIADIAYGVSWCVSDSRRFVLAGTVFLIGLGFEFYSLFGK